jgi:two-component sensor histidine kinase
MILESSKEARETTLHALIRTIFAPYASFDLSAHGDRVVIQGRDLPISGQSVSDLALLFHELATNAVKHGALSTPQGLVYIDCSVENGELSVRWTERGGPSVWGEPDNRGFGGELTRRMANQFGGRMQEEWRKEGLVIEIAVPASKLTI